MSAPAAQHSRSRWAPAIALPVITLGGYAALFIAGTVVGIIDAVPVPRIKGVN
ncbi:hypothetical protein [Pseudarthrobacter sp. NIBRBAC000502772]|uniref:hypothetical protein n=1 Tax=Pseudarthrobacter sp. NIBRBAC000502772 TaxID=2590775 RepID=UPI00143CDDFA|nr:hypothetical protein [Pseudarthrobacter sp. NIBRBAC000502772]